MVNETKYKHPAQFSDRIVKVINDLLGVYTARLSIPSRCYDPFVGVGGVAAVDWGYHKFGTEIEPKWAEEARAMNIETRIGDARFARHPSDHFGVVCTSPTCGDRLAGNCRCYWNPGKCRNEHTYEHALQRRPARGSSAGMFWGSEYRALHDVVWTQCVRQLCPGGLFVLNVKDHIRGGRVQEVAKWHVETLRQLGLEVVASVMVPLPAYKSSAMSVGRGARGVYHEWVFVLRKPLAGK